MVTKTQSPSGAYLGRPTKYDPEICKKIPPLGKQGFSRWQIAATLNIGWRNLQNWEGAHDDFRAALEEARLYALAYWENLANTHVIEAPGGPKLNTGLWSRSMSARFPNEYRENSKIEHTGPGGGAIQHDVTLDFSQSLIDDLLNMRQEDAKSNSGK